jgi:DNA-binding NarL/FixJ family response regulator
MRPLSILIADDHEVVRHGVRAVLEERPDWKICGEAATGREVLDKVRKLRPDLVILDLTMPELDRTGAIQQILSACPGAKIVVLTVHDSGEMAAHALAAGASGVVLKSDTARDLVRAVQAIDSHQLFLSPTVTKAILGQLGKTTQPGPSPSDLTPRELEVIRLLALGRHNKEVAAALDISPKTVDTHRAHIMHKLKLDTYSDLIRFAIRHQILEI